MLPPLMATLNRQNKVDKIAKRLSERPLQGITLEEIRARRNRLEELTAKSRLPELQKERHQSPPTLYVPPKRPAKSSAGVRLQPLSESTGEDNELDKQRKSDLLLSAGKRHDGEKEKQEDLIDLWRKQEDEDSHAEEESDTLPSGSPFLAAKIPKIIELLKSNDEGDRLVGAQEVRRDLSVAVCPPIDEYLKEGVAKPLVECLWSDHTLLQFEATWALTNIASGTAEHAKTVYEAGVLPPMIELLASSDSRVADQAVWAISNLAGDNATLRNAVVKEGALPPLKKLVDESSNLEFLRNLSWAFSNILRHQPLELTPQQVQICVEATQLFLYHSDSEVHSNACWSLSYVSDGDELQIQKVIDSGAAPRLVALLDSTELTTVKGALRACGNIMTGNDLQTQEVVSSGVVPYLIVLLRHSDVAIQKDSAWALSNVFAGNQKQIQSAIGHGALPALIKTIQKTDNVALKKECIWCLSNLTNGGSPEQIEAAIDFEAVEELSKCLNSADDALIQVILEGLVNIIKKSPSNTTRVTETIKRLQEAETLKKLTSHSNVVIAQKAQRLYDKCYEEN